MRQPPPPPSPSGSRDLRVKIGTSGIQVTEAGADAAQADIAAQQARVTVLRGRVESLRSERDNLVEQINDGQVAAVEAASKERLATVQGQLAENEAQLRQLEDVLAAQGIAPQAQAAQGEAGVPMIPVDPNRDIPQRVSEVMIVGTIFVGFPIALAIARNIWKRTVSGGSAATSRGPVTLPPEVTARLDRIEQAVDTIAVELERVTEGQRFVTKLLSEQQQAQPRALGAGAAPAAPIAVGEKAAAEAR